MSIFAVANRISGPPTRGRKLLWHAWDAMWLGFMVYPIVELPGHRLGLAGSVAALLALAVFAGVWLRTIWLEFATEVGERAILPWLIATCVLGAGLALGLRGAWGELFIYVSIALAGGIRLRWAVPAILLATALRGVAEVGDDLRATSGLIRDELFNQLFLVCFLGLMILFFRRSMLLIAELRVAREELARLAVTEAVAEERLRFARDLHDLLGQSLSGIALKSQLARRLLGSDPARASAEVADIEQAAQRALGDVRDAVTGYRQRGLATELDAARALLATAGVHVDVDAGPPLPEAMQEPLAWVVREATTNVLRHAFASRCEIVVSASDDVVSVEIRDDGTGSRRRGRFGNGLTGLRERLSGIGGSIEAGPYDGGYVVHARLPAGAR